MLRVNITVSKSLRLLSVFPRSPREFLDRLRMIGASRLEALRERPSYDVTDADSALHILAKTLHADLAAFMSESAVNEIEAEVQQSRRTLSPTAPFRDDHNADFLVAHLCYALSRALRPTVVVETGVCYGVTSAYILKALGVNREGRLHSIDLPPLGENGHNFVGCLVPSPLRQKWTLHRGTSRRLLWPLLEELKTIDLYVHDSLHTYRNMILEFQLAWSALRPGGVLVSDDVEGNGAFAELAAAPDVLCSAVMKQRDKRSLLGVAVKA